VESEVWALCFGSPGEGQLDILPKHVNGTPSVVEYHPFCHIDFKEQAYIRKQPSRKTAERLPGCGSEFFLDFRFMRASSDDYKCPNKATDRIVLSYDGYSAYLIIVDSASRQVWVFLTASKSPPIAIMRAFLTKFGLAGGVIRTDQGSKLARRDDFRRAMMEDSATQWNQREPIALHKTEGLKSITGPWRSKFVHYFTDRVYPQSSGPRHYYIWSTCTTDLSIQRLEPHHTKHGTAGNQMSQTSRRLGQESVFGSPDHVDASSTVTISLASSWGIQAQIKTLCTSTHPQALSKVAITRCLMSVVPTEYLTPRCSITLRSWH
jgi:hypothetical protein